jgi:hypothetical protein
MGTEDGTLRALNLNIVNQESAGQHAVLRKTSCRRLRQATCRFHYFRGSRVVHRGRRGDPHRITEHLDIVLQTSALPVVRCTVAMPKHGVRGRRDNVRLFVRAGERDPWKLLAWVNETVEPDGPEGEIPNSG